MIKDDVTKDEVLAMIIMGKQPSEVSDSELADLHGRGVLKSFAAFSSIG